METEMKTHKPTTLAEVFCYDEPTMMDLPALERFFKQALDENPADRAMIEMCLAEAEELTEGGNETVDVVNFAEFVGRRVLNTVGLDVSPY